MSAPFKGQVRVLGDNVNTDDIIPGRYLNTTDPDELAAHLFEDFAPQLGRSLRAGEIIVAGENFGCGSSREHAPIGLKARGVACVVAGSFARIFFRNALNIGLPILECPGAAEACSAGDEALVDVAAGTVTLGAGGRTLRATPLPDFIQKLICAGGLIPYVATKIAAGNREPG